MTRNVSHWRKNNKTWTNMKLFLVTGFEFVYAISALYITYLNWAYFTQIGFFSLAEGLKSETIFQNMEECFTKLKLLFLICFCTASRFVNWNHYGIVDLRLFWKNLYVNSKISLRGTYFNLFYNLLKVKKLRFRDPCRLHR